MIKGRILRLVGFAAAAGTTASLIGFAANGTGAYFTDSKSGVINASTGGVHVNTSSLTLNFEGLLPQEFKTNDVNYTNSGSAAEDIWLVLPTDGSAVAFNGGPGTAALGRYGHFAVSAPDGSFTSFNLTTAPTSSGPNCTVDAYGRGGSNQEAANVHDFPAYCPVPGAVLLSYNLAPGASGTAHITFGFTKLLSSSAAEDSPVGPVAQFKIVATQHGIFPNDPNN